MYPTIQAAVNVAPMVATISVDGSAGVCNENVLVPNVTLRMTLSGTNGSTINGAAGSPTLDLRVKGVLVQGFSITGGSRGIHLQRNANGIIDSVTVQNTGGEGILIDSMALGVVTNSAIQNNPGTGIKVAELANARIGANLPEDGGAAGPNTIQNNGGDGILVTDKATAQIVQNTISGNAGNGINVIASSSASTASNLVNANKLSGVAVSGRSYLNLGEFASAPRPDTTTTNNGQFGVACMSGGAISGNLNIGTALNGARSQFGPMTNAFDPSCPNRAAALTIAPTIRTYQSGTMLFLESSANGHTARVGLQMLWGGAITEISFDGKNFANAHDTGREVQPALFDAQDGYCSTFTCANNVAWNPTLAGDKYDHGSPVLSSQLGSDSIYVKTQPLEWNPDDKGGGPSTPVFADVIMEQTVSIAPISPFAIQLHMKITHTGTDEHFNTNQQIPVAITNSEYPNFVYYSGIKPWTGDAVTKVASIPVFPAVLQQPSSEKWGAVADDVGQGLTLFAPGEYPIVYAQSFPQSGGSGPTGDAVNNISLLSPYSFGANTVLQADVYLIPGDVTAARSVVRQLHSEVALVDSASPIGSLDVPSANSTLVGKSVLFGGWAIDNVAVLKVEILIDDVLIASPALNVDRSDVVTAYPNLAPLQCGWQFQFDSTTLANGTHTVTYRVTDSSNNVAVFLPVHVTVSN